MLLKGSETGSEIYNKSIVGSLPEIALELATWEKKGGNTEIVLVLRKVWKAKLIEETARLNVKATLKGAVIGGVIGITGSALVALIANCGQ